MLVGERWCSHNSCRHRQKWILVEELAHFLHQNFSSPICVIHTVIHEIHLSNVSTYFTNFPPSLPFFFFFFSPPALLQCDPGELVCEGSPVCIPLQNRCDRSADCLPFHSDESSCHGNMLLLTVSFWAFCHQAQSIFMIPPTLKLKRHTGFRGTLTLCLSIVWFPSVLLTPDQVRFVLSLLWLQLLSHSA